VATQKDRKNLRGRALHHTARAEATYIHIPPFDHQALFEALSIIGSGAASRTARVIWPSEDAMLIVDAQVHIWSAEPPTNASHRQVTPYSADVCIREMDAAGVNAWPPPTGGAVNRYPGSLGVLCRRPPALRVRAKRPAYRVAQSRRQSFQAGQIINREYLPIKSGKSGIAAVVRFVAD